MRLAPLPTPSAINRSRHEHCQGMGAEKPHMAIWIMVVPMGRHSEISKPYSSIYLEASQAMTDTTERKLAEKLAEEAIVTWKHGENADAIAYIEHELLAYSKQ